MVNKNKIIIAGAAADTGNLGVSALLESMVSGVSNNENSLVILDHTNGIRKSELNVNGEAIKVTFCGAKHGKRFYQPENLTNIRFNAKLFSGKFSLIAKEILSAKVMLDISGGDSFTDLYGEWRYKAVLLPKFIAIENDIPLILMPQTYGPYSTSKNKKIASNIVKNAAMAYARDEESYEVLKDLLGDDFNPSIHCKGVDVAFLLKPIKPEAIGSSVANEWFNDSKVKTIGINVSGLIYNQLSKSYSQYGFKANYQEVVFQLIKRFLDETDANIVLIPHVLVDENNFESDLAASKKVLSLFSEIDRSRICIVSDRFSSSEIKWVISQVDWFCGTRMHSTIAGLSTGIPTSAIAYSIKTKRVFKTCKQEEQVIDPRELDTVDVVDGLWECWLKKDKVKQSLEAALPMVFDTAKNQMDMINKKILTF